MKEMEGLEQMKEMEWLEQRFGTGMLVHAVTNLFVTFPAVLV
jgi:hypothetical protein